MTDPYAEKIKKCKAPKDPIVTDHLADLFVRAVRKGIDSTEMARLLNEFKIRPLVAEAWTYNSVQMTLGAMARLKESSGIARALMLRLSNGKATEEDLELIRGRCKKEKKEVVCND
jgi:hypothetical protein